MAELMLTPLEECFMAKISDSHNFKKSSNKWKKKETEAHNPLLHYTSKPIS